MPLLYFEFIHKLWAVSLGRAEFANRPRWHSTSSRGHAASSTDRSLLPPEVSAVSLPPAGDGFWRKKARRCALPSGTETGTCMAARFRPPAFVPVVVGTATVAKSFALGGRPFLLDRKWLLSVSIIPMPGILQTLAFWREASWDIQHLQEPRARQSGHLPQVFPPCCAKSPSHTGSPSGGTLSPTLYK